MSNKTISPTPPDGDPHSDRPASAAAECIWDIIVATRLFCAWHSAGDSDAARCPLDRMYGIAAEELKAGRLHRVNDRQIHIACHFAAHADVFWTLGSNCGMLGFADGFAYVQNFCTGGYV